LIFQYLPFIRAVTVTHWAGSEMPRIKGNWTCIYTFKMFLRYCNFYS
jgi:hypothetical protein